MKISISTAACLTLTAAGFAQGPEIWLTQSRQMTIATSADGFTQTAAAADFGTFSADLSHLAPFNAGGVTRFNSGIGFISCHFEGGVKGRARFRAAGGNAIGNVAVQGSVTSVVDATFQIASDQPYFIRTRGDGPAPSAAELTTIRLTSLADGQTVVESREPTLQTRTLYVGELPAGDYRFEYNALLIGSGDECDRDLRFELTFGPPPCVADANEDGGVDGADVRAFFENWENSETAADTNFDGSVDGSDVQAFFSVWEAGGC